MPTRRKYPEHELQKECLKWFKYQYPKEIIFAIPNARKTNSGMFLKAEGVLSGIPDLFLAKGNQRWNGLFIEMKYGSNKATEMQLSIHKQLNEKHYKVIICYSFDEFKREIEMYYNSFL